MATEETLSERFQAYIDACSGPGITLYEGHPAVLMREALDDISRLAAERGALMAERTSLIATKRSQLDALTARATAAEARVAQLETALKPFAEAADSIDDSEGDRIEMWEHPASMLVTAANFRRARTALSQ